MYPESLERLLAVLVESVGVVFVHVRWLNTVCDGNVSGSVNVIVWIFSFCLGSAISGYY